MKKKKKYIYIYTVKGNILAGKYSCGEIFLRIWGFFFKLAGFSPQEYFPDTEDFCKSDQECEESSSASWKKELFSSKHI